MVVDDNSDWRQFVRSLFGHSFSVIECANGATAVELYASQRPAWVLMDIVMSPMDGLAAAALIKARDPNARVIFTTQHSEKFLRDKAAALAPAGFVLKDEFWRLWEIISEKPDAPQPSAP